ncbi:MAG: NADH-quinone oxidoreductase subunit L, partial [Candidatus Omnitrophica bacterium]|nr:NADH-quinone oxidoreductase subunit L [Candidatus Omnitrophota bacterium]
MTPEITLLLIVLVPVAGALILPLIGRISSGFRNFIALCFILTSFVLSASIMPAVLAGKTIIISKQLAAGFNFVLIADSLAIFMALVSSMISAVIIFYSFGYISHYDNQNEYYCMVTLFLGAMMGLVFSANLILL